MSFKLFPKLSRELRLKIWRHALPGPRTINLSTDPISKHLLIKASNSGTLTSLYHASKESHAVVRQQYGLYFRRILDVTKFAILFNPSIDTLYISDPQALEKFYHAGLHVHPTFVKSLALYLPLKRTDLGFVFDLKTQSKIYYRILQAMVGLKELTFVDMNADVDAKQVIDEKEVELLGRDLRAALGYTEKCEFGQGHEPRLLQGVQFEVVNESNFGCQET